MDPVDVIQRAQATRLMNEDGDAVEFGLAPALSAAEIERLAAEVGVPLPRDLRGLLERTAGIVGGPLETIDFTGRSFSVGTEEMFPSGLPIAHDGFGNFWILDLTPDTPPVFFASHDPPITLYQSVGIGDFLDQAFAMLAPPHASTVADVHEDRLFNVWQDNPGTLNHSDALAADEHLHAFAAELDERFTFVDLRSPVAVGMGFSWGRYGPRTDVRRHRYERLFAYAPPKKGPGLLRRLVD